MLNLVEGQEATILSENNEFPPFTLNVKIYGVALISNTIFPAPEQWIVPAGIEMWSCFLTGSLFIYFSASKIISPFCAL